ncbi:phasin [Neorhizobium lilium]|uniref:Phasin n=1 Tax=Neorhizobium lilium TaxID=2503024 RepID=A0A3S4UN12_9HYPH|nr:phasin family protein [Neorhizobium lilium]RWX77331.1 phasin [Neorhizobium lilium]
MAYRTEDMFSFSAFDPAKFTEGFRDLAEKGASQTHEAYIKMKAAAEEATKTAESTMQSAQAGSMELGIQTIEALRTTADMSLLHMEALMGVKSVSELVELQTSFLRRQAEMTVAQAKAIQESALKLADTVAKPGKDAVEKAMGNVKAS